MMVRKIIEMADSQIVARFVEIGIEQFEADETDDISRFNKLYEEKEVLDGLRARPGDQRRLLSEFYDHMNAQVRLMSAIFTLAIFPDQARAALQAISDRNEYLQAANARGILWGMGDGTYVPD